MHYDASALLYRLSHAVPSLYSLERIQQYVDIEQETPPTKEGEPPAAWPSSGTLSVESLSARYTPDGADVLHDLTFKCESGEKIGIGTYSANTQRSFTEGSLSLQWVVLDPGRAH